MNPPSPQVLEALGSGIESSPMRSRRSISRKSVVTNAGAGLALKHEKLGVDSFERMVRLGTHFVSSIGCDSAPLLKKALTFLAMDGRAAYIWPEFQRFSA